MKTELIVPPTEDTFVHLDVGQLFITPLESCKIFVKIAENELHQKTDEREVNAFCLTSNVRYRFANSEPVIICEQIEPLKVKVLG